MRLSGFLRPGRDSAFVPRPRLFLTAFTVLLVVVTSLVGTFGIGQPVPLANAAARSTDVNFTNATAFTLQKVDESLDHGEWDEHPPDTILPGGRAHWASESNGVATGTEGRAKYILLGAVSNLSCPVRGTPLMELHWDNPYAGSNSYDESAPAGFLVYRSDGSGNNATVNWTLRRTCLSADTDGDGLPDDWETNGVTIDLGSGNLKFIDLPKMGADPNRADIFVHMDWMSSPTNTMAYPSTAIQPVVNAFNNSPYVAPNGATGINLHVDNGPNSILNFTTGMTWGDLTQAKQVDYSNVLGSQSSSGAYDWTAFQALKDASFLPTGRGPIFHYVIAAYNSAYTKGSPNSGISRHPDTDDWSSSDFIVSLGSAGSPTDYQRAGTLMHELGHNLGLRHGGDVETNYKPNYLSVMNYSYQIGEMGRLDYSNGSRPNLDENHLNEANGLGASANGFTIGYSCPATTNLTYTKFPTANVNWNCNTDHAETDIAANINAPDGSSLNTLGDFNDWANLKFRGGTVGYNGATPPPLPTFTSDTDELTYNQILHLAEPQTTLTYTGGTPGKNGWLVSPVVVSLSATEYSGMGIAYTEWSFDGTNWQSYTGPVALPEGITTFYYRSKDHAGNLEHTWQQLFKIDTLLPSASLSYTGGTPGKNGWLLSPVNVTLAASDPTPGSGLDHIEYSFDGASWLTYSAPFPIANEGITTLYYRAFDLAGNQSPTQQQIFKIDTRPPTSKVSPVLTSGALKLGYTVTDPTPGSGPAGLHYKVRNEDGTQAEGFASGGTGTITLSENFAEVEFWSEDIAGNEENPHHKLAVSWKRPTLAQLSDYQALGDTFGQRDSGHGLANLIDVSPPGNHTALDTFWRWTGAPRAVALQVDMTSAQSLAGVRIFTHDPTKGPHTYFQYSQSATSGWSDVPGLSDVDVAVSYGVKLYPLQTVTARYWRLVIDNTTFLEDVGYLSDLVVGVFTVDGAPLAGPTGPQVPPTAHRLRVASTAASKGQADQVLDNRPWTNWIADGKPAQAQLTLNLGSLRTITALNYFVTYSAVAYHTKIEVSSDPSFPNDPSKTKVIVNETNTGGNGIAPNPPTGPSPTYGANSISGFGAVSGQYVRITILNPEGNWALGGYGSLDVIGY